MSCCSSSNCRCKLIIPACLHTRDTDWPCAQILEILDLELPGTGNRPSGQFGREGINDSIICWWLLGLSGCSIHNYIVHGVVQPQPSMIHHER
jgi:hypothetical protein